MSEYILITGGAGYIGSHMAGYFLKKKLNFAVLDNFSRSNKKNIKRLEDFFKKKIKVFNCDIRDINKLKSIFDNNKFDSVIHFAALKSISESIKEPDLYYTNNVTGSKNILECVELNKIKNFIFSSTAAVYGNPKYLPIDENHPTIPTNPYAKSKKITEDLLLSNNYLKTINLKILRYFNPIGSFDNSIIGEDVLKSASNIMPHILATVFKKIDYLKIYGNDYSTIDGTGVRDYIHIMDLVEAHFFAIKNNSSLLPRIINIGSGINYSVLELKKIFENINNVEIPFKFFPRREGDIGSVYADNSLALDTLNWLPSKTIEDMCLDSYNFYYANKK
jgi:UDP-glucose 4-epimerase